MSTYQTYDFVKDINFHINNNNPIDLNSKSEIFKDYLFKLKIFQMIGKIKQDHPMFNEDYFIFTMYSKVYVAKRLNNININPNSSNFDYIEILNGIKIIRKMKLKKLYNFCN